MTQDTKRIEELEAEVQELREVVKEQDSGGTSRRKFLGGVAAAGVLGASTGSASAQSGVGGGPASDELAHLRQYLYGGPLDDQDDGGIANRVYLADDGTLQRDDGSGWGTADLGVSNLHSELVNTEDTLTETLSYDHSERWPQSTSMPTIDGPLAFEKHPTLRDPILTLDSTEDWADGIADPFCAVDTNGKIHIFAELLDRDYSSTARGIAKWSGYDLANLSYDGLTYTSDDVGHNVNYPFTHKVGGKWYQYQFENSTDSVVAFEIDLEANSYTKVETLLSPGFMPKDPTLFEFNGHWWLSVHNSDFVDRADEERHLYYSDSPISDSWTAHPENPVEMGDHARNAGRPIVYDTFVDMFARPEWSGTIEGDASDWGEVVHAIRVHELTTSSYKSVPHPTNPVLSPDGNQNGWTEVAMHHIDPLLSRVTGQDIAIVDGVQDDYRVGVYTTTSDPPTGAKASVDSASISSSSMQTVQYGHLNYDHSNSFDPDGFTAPKSGWWHVRVNHSLGDLSGTSPPLTVTTQLENVTQGSSKAWRVQEVNTTDARTLKPIDGEFWLDKGDKVSINATTSAGSDIPLGNHSRFEIEFKH